MSSVRDGSVRFILDNAAKDGCTGGINSIDEILFQVGPNFELVNGYFEDSRLAGQQCGG